MEQTTQPAEAEGLPTVLHRAVPLVWQLGAGLLAAALALAAVHLPSWPGDTLWRLMPINLLAVTAAAAGVGLFAGLTAACLILLFYVDLFTGSGPHGDVVWLPLLAVATLGIAIIAGWLRASVGRLERELRGTRMLLQGTNRRLQAAHEAERLRAYYDHTTDLPSRRMVTDRFSQMVSQARRAEKLVALLLLDLTHFKEVNESVGHDAGDEVLRQVGQRLSAVMRKEDTVGRLDSDTFVVLLGGLGEPAGVTIAAHKIAEALEAPLTVGTPPREVHIAASMGAAIYPHDGNDWDTLYQYAEESMRLAKQPA